MATPVISKGRDQSDLQDIYRRALAASWAAMPGELAADACIEDIFSGGDGWKGGFAKQKKLGAAKGYDESGGGGEHHIHTHHRNDSSSSMKSQNTIKEAARGHKHSRSREPETPIGMMSPDQEQANSDESERGRTGFRKAHEVDEFEMRDDLVAWKLPGKVSA